MNRFKRIWFKALGEKASDCDRESDQVGIVRTILIVQSIITNLVIICGVIRHWQ